jgi:hypothetical protein
MSLRPKPAAEFLWIACVSSIRLWIACVGLEKKRIFVFLKKNFLGFSMANLN